METNKTGTKNIWASFPLYPFIFFLRYIRSVYSPLCHLSWMSPTANSLSRLFKVRASIGFSMNVDGLKTDWNALMSCFFWLSLIIKSLQWWWKHFHQSVYQFHRALREGTDIQNQRLSRYCCLMKRYLRQSCQFVWQRVIRHCWVPKTYLLSSGMRKTII